ncbi:hypothetical protein BDK51DRAFT_27817 [Blyttiomyces helicus]|uniref:Uncharacterized protein n=1 Tax=Blyttiomyces helicus TaxID=388810 RepID=A0A4P9WTX8_9FUNG|nr:hypothetical protein BDK51DRAFT_27817 [Blyttiomyces helicus]|eukprot:RKO94556.1 hypothetical protein BDK51DRAFT_27817 [Blyttiomyces helicus]
MRTSLIASILLWPVCAVLGQGQCNSYIESDSSSSDFIAFGATVYFDLNSSEELVVNYVAYGDCVGNVSPVLTLPSGSKLSCTTAPYMNEVPTFTTCHIEHSQLVAGQYSIVFNVVNGPSSTLPFTVVNTQVTATATSTTTVTPTYTGTFSPTSTSTIITTSILTDTTTLAPVTITSPAATFGTLVIHPTIVISTTNTIARTSTSVQTTTTTTTRTESVRCTPNKTMMPGAVAPRAIAPRPVAPRRLSKRDTPAINGIEFTPPHPWRNVDGPLTTTITITSMASASPVIIVTTVPAVTDTITSTADVSTVVTSTPPAQTVFSGTVPVTVTAETRTLTAKAWLYETFTKRIQDAQPFSLCGSGEAYFVTSSRAVISHRTRVGMQGKWERGCCDAGAAGRSRSLADEVLRGEGGVEDRCAHVALLSFDNSTVLLHRPPSRLATRALTPPGVPRVGHTSLPFEKPMWICGKRMGGGPGDSGRGRHESRECSKEKWEGCKHKKRTRWPTPTKSLLDTYDCSLNWSGREELCNRALLESAPPPSPPQLLPAAPRRGKRLGERAQGNRTTSRIN